MPVYKWKEGFRAPTPAQLVGERLESIRNEQGGKLTPAAVVDDARPEDSPLHNCFEWDDEIAAQHFRLDQARSLINHVVTVIQGDGKDHNVRAFVNVTTADKERHYTSMTFAMSQEELRHQVLQTALKELERWQERYKEYTELADIFAAIDSTKAA